MGITVFSRLVWSVRQLAVRNDRPSLSDADALGSYISNHDSDAFETLLRRHGPMVVGVCRRVLGNEADAEDAFQATFLVLVLKAESIRPRSQVGSWLYGVARTTALKARAMRAKRAEKEFTVGQRRAAQFDEDSREPWTEVLDHAIGTLSEKYRSALVLCELHGKSLKEAAEELQVPVATVGTRLARARAMVKERLQRMGMWGPALAVGFALPSFVQAQVPPAWLQATVPLGTSTSIAHASASSTCIFLAQGVLQDMFRKQLYRSVLALGLVLAVLASTVFFRFESPGVAQGPPPKAEVAAKKNAKRKDDLTARQIVDRMTQTYKKCETYQDTGTVLQIFMNADGTTRKERHPFETAFVRPGRFRFQSANPSEQAYVVWKNGPQLQTWWDIKPGIEVPESLDIGLGAASGISGGSATNVPPLLMPDSINLGRIIAAEMDERLDDLPHDNVDCYRIRLGNGMAKLLWIEQKRFVIRRIDFEKDFGNFQLHQITTYDPTLNAKVPEKKLEFRP